MSSYPQVLSDAWAEHLAPKAPDAPTVVSTFAGCGGSSLGYSMAGYRELVAVEWVEHAAHLIRRNFPHVEVFQGDIADYDPATAGLEPGELDVLDGSPPCQGFSTAGVRIMHDPRNQLFREFVRLLTYWQPKAFVMENVTGMVKGKMRLVFAEVLAALSGAGYRVRVRKLDASYLGVPQTRQRLIFVGVRQDLGLEPVHPEPMPGRVTVAQALAPPLPALLEAPALTARMAGLVALIPPGGNGGDVLEQHGRKGNNFALVRSHPHRPAATITAANNLQVHPRHNRYLNTAELARLQSFPDEFDWDLEHSDHASIRWRIGNSVPPLMMRAIATTLRHQVLEPARQLEGVS